MGDISEIPALLCYLPGTNHSGKLPGPGDSVGEQRQVGKRHILCKAVTVFLLPKEGLSKNWLLFQHSRGQVFSLTSPV